MTEGIDVEIVGRVGKQARDGDGGILSLAEEVPVGGEDFQAALTVSAAVRQSRYVDRGNHGAGGIDQVADRGGALVPGFAGLPDHADESGRRRAGMEIHVEGHGALPDR